MRRREKATQWHGRRWKAMEGSSPHGVLVRAHLLLPDRLAGRGMETERRQHERAVETSREVDRPHDAAPLLGHLLPGDVVP